MKKLLALLLIINVISRPCYPYEPNQIFSDQKELRINQLLPNVLIQLGVEPALPDNFIAMSPDGTFNIYKGIYWGPKEELEKYFKNPKSLSQAIIFVAAGRAIQEDIVSPTNKISEELKKFGLRIAKEHRFNWDSYPVYAVCLNFFGMQTYMAWVGLNELDGSTLKFQLICPEERDLSKPNKEDMQLWSYFLNRTRQLPEKLFFKACGQDMEMGYTLVSIGGAKLKVTAEQRVSDNKLQVVAIPLADNVDFKISKTGYGCMGAQWHYGDPLVKVYGILTQDEGKSKLIVDHCISVLVKTVEEFSVDLNNLEATATKDRCTASPCSSAILHIASE